MKQCTWRIQDARGSGQWNCQEMGEHSIHTVSSTEHSKTVGEWFDPNASETVLEWFDGLKPLELTA